MSQESLLTIPHTLSILKQAYCIVDQQGDVLWTNQAFERFLGNSMLLQIRDQLKRNLNTDCTRQLLSQDNESIGIEFSYQPYSEIVPGEGEGLYLCLCKEINPKLIHSLQKENTKQDDRMTSLLEESQGLAKIGAWEFDLLTERITWTNEVYRIYEVEKGFMKNVENVMSFYHDDDRQMVIDSVTKATENQEEFDLIARFITAKKSLICVRVTGKPHVENGKVVKLVGLIHNITERIEIEHQLKEEQAQLRQITDRFRLAAKAAGIGVWDYYPVENKLVWDEQTYNLYGVEESEFEGAYDAWERHVHPEDKEEAVNELGMALSGEKDFNTEFRVILSDGTIRYLSGVGTVIRNEQNEPIRMTGVNADITERKRHLDQLNLLQAVVETTLDSIIITEANVDGQKILYANPAHEQMTGYSLQEIMGQSPRIFQGPGTDVDELRRVRDALGKGENVQAELLNYGKDGGEYWVNMIITYVKDQAGSISHFVSVQQDITNQKKNQQALIEAKELAENASEAKSEFLSTMSHEIRTPLNAVIGMTGLLAETDLTEEQVEFLDTIRNGGESLLSVINDILDYSKIEAGKIELERETFPLLDPIENTLDLLAGKAYKKRIELMYRVEKPIPKLVKGDVTRLSQVLINLIGNAIKFTAEGEILVGVRQVEQIKGEIRLEFSIKDTGIGIPKEKLNRLFQSFSQVDASTTRKFGGTGLGLAISRKLVELQGGEIWVESEEGLGSTFFFSVVLDFVPDTPESTTHLNSLEGKRVLIVDNNQTNLSILQNQLTAVGMEVLTCNSPQEVLSFCYEQKNNSWDLCILDFHMPGMNGFELGKSLLEIPGYEDIPMVLLDSGYNMQEDSHKDIFDLILNKPVKLEKLMTRLGMIFSSNANEIDSSRKVDNRQELDISSFKILLAEDNLINQKVAKKMLEKFHAKLEIANNGLEAFDLVKSQAFDLVLMDMQMPEMDGVQASHAIRQLQGIQQPLILAMTANVSEDDRKACIQAGMNDFISKPIKLEVLRATLQKWLLSIHE